MNRRKGLKRGLSKISVFRQKFSEIAQKECGFPLPLYEICSEETQISNILHNNFTLRIAFDILKMPPDTKARQIAVMGFRSVGKSSLTIQFVENQFVDSYDPTIENTFDKPFKINGQQYQLKIIDTAGQDEYSIFPQSLSVNIHGYVLVYAVTSAKSFEVVQIIYEKLLDMTGKVTIPLVLVGNKTDLHMERSISTQQGKQLADSWGATFIESSAKQNESVEEIFKKVLELIDGNPQMKDEKCVII